MLSVILIQQSCSVVFNDRSVELIAAELAGTGPSCACFCARVCECECECVCACVCVCVCVWVRACVL